MIAKGMERLVKNNSVIRQMFEEGKELVKKYGKENVFDFSLGNPSVEPPKQVNEIIEKLLKEDTDIHGYMANNGYEEVRKIIAKSLNNRFTTNFSEKNICMCVGAAGRFECNLKINY